MPNSLAGVLFAASALTGAQLRSALFRAAGTARQNALVLTWHLALSLLAIPVFAACIDLQNGIEAIRFIQLSNLVYGVLSAIPAFLCLRSWIRGQAFLLGITLSIRAVRLSFLTVFVSLLPPAADVTGIFLVLILDLAAAAVLFRPLRTLLSRVMAPVFTCNADNCPGVFWPVPLLLCMAHLVNIMQHGRSVPALAIGSLISLLLLVFLCRGVLSGQKQLDALGLLRTQLTEQASYYAQLQASVEDARKTRHDFKNHVAVLRYLISIDDKEGMARYCEELAERTGDLSVPLPNTGSHAVDGILFRYHQLAAEQHIAFTYAGSLQAAGILDVDICALLGNALDNALAGCMTVPTQRRIAVGFSSAQNQLLISVRNTFDGNVEQKGSVLFSRKREHLPGIGLTSMRAICERYGGNMEVQWDKETFTTLFLLPMSPR